MSITTTQDKLLSRQGALSTGERWRFTLQATQAKLKMIVGSMGLQKTHAKPLGRLNPDAIPRVDSAFAKAAVEAMESASSPTLVHHCYRTYIWGWLLKQLDDNPCDAEVLFVSAMLHDLGLTEQYHGCCEEAECFTWDSVHGARSVLAVTDPQRANAVSQAILGHLNIKVPGETCGWEAHYLQAGASLDVTGQRYSDISPDIRHNVLQQHPRLQLKRELQQWVDREAQRHPRSRFAAMKTLGFKGVIGAAPFES